MAASRKIRVLYLIDELGGGGAERCAVNMACGLDPQRFQVKICSTRKGGQYEEELRFHKQDYVVLPDERGKFDIVRMWHIFREIRSFRPDILHSHKYGSNVWGRVLGTVAGVRVIVAHEHTWHYRRWSRHGLVDRLLFPLSDAVLVPSEYDLRQTRIVMGGTDQRVRVLRNGVAAPTGSHNGNFRNEAGRDRDCMVVVSVGGLRPQKAYDVLVAVAAEVLRRAPGRYQFLIIGDGPERTRLQGLAAELGLERDVVFMGQRSDVSDIVKGADLFLNTSQYEGLSLAILEAMSLGVPVIASDVGGTGEIIRNMVNGVLCHFGDVEGFADALERLSGDPEERALIALEGYHTWETQGRNEVMLKQLEEIYCELLGQNFQ